MADLCPWALKDSHGVIVLRAHQPHMLHPLEDETVSYEPREDSEE